MNEPQPLSNTTKSYENQHLHELVKDVAPSIFSDAPPADYSTKEERQRHQILQWQKNNPEALRKAQRKYREKNKDRFNEKARAKYAENKEKVCAYRRSKRRENEDCAAAAKMASKKNYEKRKQQRIAQDPDFKKKMIFRDLRSKLKALQARNRALNNEINENKSKIMDLKAQLAELKKDDAHLSALHVTLENIKNASEV